MSPSVTVDGASVRFGHVVALDAARLDVPAGEVLAVLGPSGSGKSTLLRAIAGLQPLTSGRILLGDRDLAGVPPHARGVGLMFQDHALFPHRDVAGNVAFGLRMQGCPKPEIARRVSELLTLVDLPGFGARRIQTLSGGEQQRVALARALAPRPEVLLLDEPLGSLDRVLRDRLVGDLRSLFVRLGLTVIAVTHDRAEAFGLADRIAVMDAGSVLQAGSPEDLWARPASRRVAHLLGLANVTDAVVAQGCARTPWGEVALPRVGDGPVTIVIRPSGVLLDQPGGGALARVESVSFDGDRTSVRLVVDGAPALHALVPAGAAPARGQLVRVTLDPAATSVIAGGGVTSGGAAR